MSSRLGCAPENLIAHFTVVFYGQLVKQCKPTKTWERTRLQNLIRHKSGRYSARAFAGGKEVWKSLKTSHFSVAQAKLAEVLREHRERISNGTREVSPKMTFGQAAAIHL